MAFQTFGSSRRQVIDLRTSAEREGITGNVETIRAITGIMQILGQVEQKRRERETLDRVIRAIGEGATTAEAIAKVAGQPAQISGGISGILQKLGGAFQPSPGGLKQSIQQAIIGQKLQQALTPQVQIPEGLEPTGATVSPTGGVTRRFTKPTVPKPVERKGFSLAQTKALAEAIPKALDAIADRVDKTAIKGLNKRSQADLAKEYKNTALEAGYETWTEDQRKQFDRKWDRLARAKFKPRKAISKDTGGEINVGWNPNSPEVKQARKELRAGIQKTKVREEVSDTDVRLQSAPDVRLDPFWADLPDEEKKEIIQRLDEDPENINSILRILQSG